MAHGTAPQCGRVGSCHIYLKSLSVFAERLFCLYHAKNANGSGSRKDRKSGRQKESNRHSHVGGIPRLKKVQYYFNQPIATIWHPCVALLYNRNSIEPGFASGKCLSFEICFTQRAQRIQRPKRGNRCIET